MAAGQCSPRQDRWGGTPLLAAIRNRQELVANLLRESGGELQLDDPALMFSPAAKVCHLRDT